MSKEGSSDLFQEPHCLPTMWEFWEALCNRTFPSSRNSPMGHTRPTVHIHTELSYIAGGSGKWYSHSGRELAISYKHRLTTWPSNPTPRHLPKRNKNICPKTCSWMFIAASFIMGSNWKTIPNPPAGQLNKQGVVPSMGSHRVGHDWSDLAAAAAFLIKKKKTLYILRKL